MSELGTITDITNDLKELGLTTFDQSEKEFAELIEATLKGRPYAERAPRIHRKFPNPVRRPPWIPDRIVNLQYYDVEY
jgi:hypothetical protein